MLPLDGLAENAVQLRWRPSGVNSPSVCGSVALGDLCCATGALGSGDTTDTSTTGAVTASPGATTAGATSRGSTASGVVPTDARVTRSSWAFKMVVATTASLLSSCACTPGIAGVIASLAELRRRLLALARE